jgi:hypothetical protein
VKTETLPSWLQPVRIAGVLLGLAFIFCSLAADMLASEAEPAPADTQLFAQRVLFAIAALPLVMRWRSIQSRFVRRILLVLLAGDALYFAHSLLNSTIWAFKHGERVQFVAALCVSVCVTVVLFAQFSAISHISKESGSNAT